MDSRYGASASDMEERSRRRRRAAVAAAGAVLVAGTFAAARATRDLPASAEPSPLEHSSMRGASRLSGGEGRRLGRIADVFHRFYVSPGTSDEGDGEEPAVSSGPRPMSDPLPPIGDPLPKDNRASGSGRGWGQNSLGDTSSSGACSSLSRAECAQSTECKLHRGICVHTQSNVDKAAMRQAEKCARKRKKRCKRTDDCEWDAAATEGAGRCVPKGVPQPDDGDSNTGNGDKETNGEGQKEKQAKYWPRKVDGGHACVFSDGYPAAYKNVRRPMLFDKWEECCAAYSPCVESDPKALLASTVPNVVAVTDPTMEATEPNGAGTGATEPVAEPVQPAKCALGTFSDTHSCAENEYCALNDGTCATDGVWWGKCAPLPNREGCSEDYSPVCGCDGFTYGNECKARVVGVSVKHVGGCGAQEGTGTSSTPGYATFPTEGATQASSSAMLPAATEPPLPAIGAAAPHCRESREAPCWYPHRLPDGTKTCAYDDLYPDGLFEAAKVELFLFPTEEGCCAVYREACPHLVGPTAANDESASPQGTAPAAEPPSDQVCYPDVRSSTRSCHCSAHPPPLMDPTWFFSSEEECCASWECHAACREERGAPCFYPHLNDDGTKVCRYDGDYPKEYFENEMLRRDFLFGDEDQCCLNFPEACLIASSDAEAPEEPTAAVVDDATTTRATTANASTEGSHDTSGAAEPPKTTDAPPLSYPACAIGPSAPPERHTCPSTEFCQTTQCADTTLQMGSCAPKRVRDECWAEPYDPVCGCDGWTYGNLCSAAAEGVSVRWRGGCGGPPTIITEAAPAVQKVGPDPTTSSPAGGLTGRPSSTPTATPSKAPSKAPIASARCAVGPAVGTSPCPSHEYCRLDAGTCLAPKAVYYGACAPKSRMCTMMHAPVCGCDGVTYGSDCLASAAGASVRMVGECPGGGSALDPISDPTSEFADADMEPAECPGGHCRSPGGRCQPRVECVDDPCDGTFCPEGYVCEANSCGGCSASCALAAAARKEAAVVPLPVSPYIAVSPDEDPAVYNAPELLVSPAIGALPPGDTPAGDPRIGQQGPTCDVATHEGCSAGQICGTAPGVYCAASGCLPSCHCNYLATGSDGSNGCDVGEVCRQPCAMADAGPMCFKSNEERDCGLYGAGFVCRDGNGDGVIDEKDGTHGCVHAAASNLPGLADDGRWGIGLDERPMRVTGDLEHGEQQGEGAGRNFESLVPVEVSSPVELELDDGSGRPIISDDPFVAADSMPKVLAPP
ncbi:hypothetical protein ACHAXT_011137 [Thalassiosira profunda]